MTKTNYTDEEKEEIIKQISVKVINGGNLTNICKKKEFPNRATIYNWFNENKVLHDIYTRAREGRADFRSERIDSLCGKVEKGKLDPNAARVIIDAQKWQASKENRNLYGDQVGLDDRTLEKLSDGRVELRLTQLLGKAGINDASGGEGTQGSQEEDI